MKKQFWSIVLLAALGAIPFTGCQKDTTEPSKHRRGGWIGLLKVFNSCEPGSFFCYRPDSRPFPDLLNVRASTDEIAVLPMAQEDGSITLTGKVETKNLSDRAYSTLVERRVLELNQEAIFGEEILRAAYENAGRTYKGERITVPKGAYKVNVEGNSNGQRPPQITITITIKCTGTSCTITITISW